jgi:hypothetical protein
MQICMNAYDDVSKKPCIVSHGFKSFCQGPVCTVENGYIVRLGSGNYSHVRRVTIEKCTVMFVLVYEKCLSWQVSSKE